MSNTRITNDILAMLDIRTAYGRDTLKGLNKYTSVSSLEKEYDLMDEFEKHVDLSKVAMQLRRIPDARMQIDAAFGEQLLDAGDFFTIKRFCLESEKLLEILKNLGSPLILPETAEIFRLLNPSGKDDYEFMYYGEYDARLWDIRAKKRSIEREYHHGDESLKAERAALVEAERKLESKIASDLSREIHKFGSLLRSAAEMIGRIDLTVAKLRLFTDLQTRPKFTDGYLEVTEAHNPLVTLQLEGTGLKYKPVSILIKRGSTIITGVNMGGKSTFLRTLMMNIELMSLGLRPFASCLHAPLITNVKLIMNTSENPECGLSTFGSEISALSEMLTSLNEENTLILVDEFARSTNPHEGQLFVKALAGHLHEKNAFSVISTHYDDIPANDMTHYEVIGIDEDALWNIKKEDFFAEIHRQMDYGLKKVERARAPRKAFEIAKYFGLPQEFMERYKRLMEEKSEKA